MKYFPPEITVMAAHSQQSTLATVHTPSAAGKRPRPKYLHGSSNDAVAQASEQRSKVTVNVGYASNIAGGIQPTQLIITR